ncbi:MAG: acyl-CoA synthetase FdrA [Helcococcus sp.]|nr:acyl-CoA synthetase FdrA [Helcococcus sp.]
MISKFILKKDEYYDSVTLMVISKTLSTMEGVENAFVYMGTEMNKDMIIKFLPNLTEEVEKATSNDLMIAINGSESLDFEKIVAELEKQLKGDSNTNESNSNRVYKNINEVLEEDDDYNIAIISIAGEYAFREAMRALKKGLHVMLFSDNVSIEDEIKLKEYAKSKNLLLMGPDCGTSILNGVGLCFANETKKGDIGIIGASGTGIQEAVVQLNKVGLGISQAIGIGGRDLTSEVGGIMMLSALDYLAEDENTKEIVLISKPPAQDVKEKIIEKIMTIDKPKVICFIDSKDNKELPNTQYVDSLSEIARVCAKKEKELKLSKERLKELNSLKSKVKSNKVVGLYCGGTLCAEALHLLRNSMNPIYSNVAKKEEEKIKTEEYKDNVLIDLGDDKYTVGRAHPMIDPSVRLLEIEKYAKSDKYGVMMLDFELGYGSNESPVKETAELLKKLKEEKQDLIVISYICGTKEDYQGYQDNKSMLEEISIIADSNEEMCKIAEYLLTKDINKE